MTSEQNVEIIAAKSHAAARLMASATPRTKNAFLQATADLLEKNRAYLLAENQKDLQQATGEGLDEWRLDRMRVTDKTIDSLIKACKHVASLPDPIGATETQWQQPNGILVGKMRIPIGVIAMIYEARPAVTIDAAILALKAGNAILLRGGKECMRSNLAFGKILSDALAAVGLPADAAQIVQGGHACVEKLCELSQYIDLMIPRGGEALIRAVSKAATMPVLMHFKGVCHAYIDMGANLEKALDIVENSKSQRPGVCNALECLLVNREEAARFLPALAQRLAKYNVEFKADPGALPLLLPHAVPLKQEDLGHEFAAQILAVCIVENMDEAMEHIAKYGSRHTEIICTEDYTRAMRFLREVDSSMVGVNASTRFNDGGELGLGAEIGISTSKLHAYGPMGVKELTTTKFVVLGNGQVRQ